MGFLIEAWSEWGVFRRRLGVSAGHNAKLELAYFQSLEGKKIIIASSTAPNAMLSPKDHGRDRQIQGRDLY